MKTKLIIIAVSVFMLSAIYAFAQKKNVSKSDSTNVSAKRGYNFVDKNKDGICDNWQSSKPNRTVNGKNFVDKNKDGICDNRQVSKNNQSGKGRNFVDKNNDGICDNRQGNNSWNCCGKGYCHGKGNGNGYQHRHGWRNANQ
jgi:hypothetical protein